MAGAAGIAIVSPTMLLAGVAVIPAFLESLPGLFLPAMPAATEVVVSSVLTIHVTLAGEAGSPLIL